MKTLYATVGALALMLSAAACGNGETDTYEAAETAEVPAMTETDTMPAESLRAEYVLAAGEMEASDLMGASVHDASNTEISVVEDVFLSNGSDDAVLILRDGGVAGVGGDLRALAFDAATIVPDPDTSGDEPKVIVQFSSATLESLPSFKQAGADDFRLASEMIGKTVGIGATGESARINDLILSANGDSKYAVISPDLVSMERILVDASAITLAEGDTDGEVTLDVTADTLAAASAYKR